MRKIQKRYKLFLDDIRDLEETYSYTKFSLFKEKDWIIVRNYTQFIKTIELNYYNKNAFPEIISFEHDLAHEHYLPKEKWGMDYNSWATNQDFNEKTGYNCAEWLIDFCIKNEIELPKHYCHSMNPAGKENIINLLSNFEMYQKINNFNKNF